MTEELLQKLTHQYHVPVHIQKHMKKVAAVALYLGQMINQRGQKVDLVLLRQACLLHDMVKLCDFKNLDLENFEQDVSAEDIQFWTALMKSCNHIGHSKAAYNILMDIDEHKIAAIILKHHFDSLISEDKPITWEEKLLYYADKRVKHDQIVSIIERLRDGRERYFPDGNVPANDYEIEKALFVLQNEICTAADLNPEDITEKAVGAFLES